MGTFGKTENAVPRARLNTADGKTAEWKSQSLRAYQRRTLAADALIAGTYLGRHQYAPGAPCPWRPVWRGGRQGHGELAQGEERFADHIRALTARRLIEPTSLRCPSAWQPTLHLSTRKICSDNRHYLRL
jgi:hypothetical protein